MNDVIKQRIVGGVVIVAVLAIFLPILLHKSKPLKPVTVALNEPAAVQADSENLQLQLPDKASAPTTAVAQNKTFVAKPVVASQSAPVVVPATPKSHVAKKAPVIDSVPFPYPKGSGVHHHKINNKILAQAVTPPEAWVIQVGSFSSAANAKHLVARLRHAKMDAYTRQSTNHKITRVFIGPKVHRRDINVLQRRLTRDFHLHGIVRQYSA